MRRGCVSTRHPVQVAPHPIWSAPHSVRRLNELVQKCLAAGDLGSPSLQMKLLTDAAEEIATEQGGFTSTFAGPSCKSLAIPSEVRQ